MNTKKWGAIVVLALMCSLMASASADIAVIVSAKSPVGNLTAEQVAQIFLGKTGTFPGGQQTIPLDQSEGQAAREEFYSKVTGKSASQVKAYWSKIIFTGKGQPPKELANTADVKKLIANNPNMIGYIEKSQIDASVKAVYAD